MLPTWCGEFGAFDYKSLQCYSDLYYRNWSLGDWSGKGTPGNIPNPEVKLASADGTWGATPWESRSLPRDFSFNYQNLFLLIFLILSSATPLPLVGGRSLPRDFSFKYPNKTFSLNNTSATPLPLVGGRSLPRDFSFNNTSAAPLLSVGGRSSPRDFSDNDYLIIFVRSALIDLRQGNYINFPFN